MKNSIVTKRKKNTKSILSKLLIVPVILLLGACSTSYTPVTDKANNYDFASISSYNIVGDDELKNPLISDMDRTRIDNGINTTLQSKGKTQTTEVNADVLISYFIVTKDKVKVTGSYSGGYYGNSGCYRCASGVGVTHINTRDYVEGTIVVDVIDNSSKQSVWRSTLTKPLKDYDNSEERDQAIQQSVESMFKDLPVS